LDRFRHPDEKKTSCNLLEKTAEDALIHFYKKINWFYATPVSTGCTYATKINIAELTKAQDVPFR
jgi:hypothetical protein